MTNDDITNNAVEENKICESGSSLDDIEVCNDVKCLEQETSACVVRVDGFVEESIIIENCPLIDENLDQVTDVINAAVVRKDADLEVDQEGEPEKKSEQDHEVFDQCGSEPMNESETIDLDHMPDVLDDTESDQWKVNKVMTIAELTKGRWAKICSNEECNLKAAVEYVSTIDPTNIRSYCLDCQVRNNS